MFGVPGLLHTDDIALLKYCNNIRSKIKTITIFGKPTHIIAGDNQHYYIDTSMRVGGKSRIALPTYKCVLRPKGWVHEDGRVRTFTYDVERSVVVVLRCYTLHGQVVTTSKALTQIRRDIVSGDMTLKPSREDVCETFHAGRLDTGALGAAGDPLAGRMWSRRQCLPSVLTLQFTPTGD